MCLPSMNTLFKKNLPLLHIDNNLNTLFLTETFKVVYRRNKNLKELLTLSLFPTRRREKNSCVTSCNTCDIRKNYMVFSSTFFWTVTGEKYYIRGNFSCNSTNVNYAVKFINCKCQNVGSATFLKQCFRIHKSDIKAKKDRFRTARHFNSICDHPVDPHGYLKVQLIGQVFCGASKGIENNLWEHEQYCQCQLSTNMHGMNSNFELYMISRKGCRKK